MAERFDVKAQHTLDGTTLSFTAVDLTQTIGATAGRLVLDAQQVQLRLRRHEGWAVEWSWHYSDIGSITVGDGEVHLLAPSGRWLGSVQILGARSSHLQTVAEQLRAFHAGADDGPRHETGTSIDPRILLLRRQARQRNGG